MKTYHSFEQIEGDLKRLSLERQIALEELKIVKNDFEITAFENYPQLPK